MGGRSARIVTRTDLPDLGPCRRGKVRDIYDLGEQLLIVATDRISAFDIVLLSGIPDKGRILTQISAYWFELLSEITDSHLVTADFERMPERVRKHGDLLEGRSMLVRKCDPYPVEAIVRGYLAGSGYKEYRTRGGVCGIPLPGGLTLGSKLPEPIFTPSTKAEDGHDENISYEQMVRLLPEGIADEIRSRSLAIYARGRDHAETRGILIADTKFEFGRDSEGRLVLIDELLSPDSSRFWPAEEHAPGTPLPSYDKQIVRDFLETSGWDKTPPPPELPAEIVELTARKYREIHERLTGRPFDAAR
jgi:phosphoribosylaminoimidazole-succinocarboxamide synthase